MLVSIVRSWARNLWKLQSCDLGLDLLSSGLDLKLVTSYLGLGLTALNIN